MHSNSSRSPRRLRSGLGFLAIAASAALVLTGCVQNNEGGAPGGTDAAPVAEVTKSDAASALVPEDIASGGVLKVGTDATYAPNQYAGPDGNPIGWEVELVDAVGAKLGLTVEWSKEGFDQIIPKVDGGTLHMGSSSFSDTVERQASVDFVDFYEAGLQFVRGAEVDPLPAELCGLTIGAQATTTSDDYLMAKSDECVAAGKPAVEILKKDGQDEATNDVVLGNVPYMLADSPIAQNSVKLSEGKVVLEGDIFDAAPYGLVFAKDSQLTEAVKIAMQELMDEGVYTTILENWGVEAGAVTTAVINGVK
ncbi:ABC transporter substrate-binding protein [Gulosibacter macacae]|uniref:ABC transporter substrate-binding protein n=1 Tax=Gulosibacter macacae TaxID=2488791 RepID=A0A3P3W1C6_9MICO|nr:transporter substrate-binding domain-containing protein [Gulosibacter macacae]RRJ88825.1 ABC transporter substrate-binding protein [Gulosibacter macacae]